MKKIPALAKEGCSVLTTAVGLPVSQSGHFVPIPRPPSGVMKNKAFFPTHKAERPSVAVTKIKSVEVA